MGDNTHVPSTHTYRYIEIPWVVPVRVLTWLSARGLLNCFRTLACSIACSMDAWAAPNEQDAEETLKCHKWIKWGLFFNFYSYKQRTSLKFFFNFLALHDDSTIKVSLITVKSSPQDAINESIIWKMNLLVFSKTSIKFKSTFLHAEWAVNFYDNLSVFWSG